MNLPMVIATSGNLRRMGYHKQLIALRQTMQTIANSLSNGATNPGIDFVKDHGLTILTRR